LDSGSFFFPWIFIYLFLIASLMHT
jgi:hypothetical protein